VNEDSHPDYSVTCGNKKAEWRGLRPPQGLSAFRKRAPYRDVAARVCDRSGYPDMLCILGRGIELYGPYQNRDTTLPSNWRPTAYFERIREDTRNHTGYWTPHVDLTESNMSIGGGNANVRAAYVLLRGLAELDRLPSTILFCAGRTKYVQDHNPTGEVSEGIVMRNKLFMMLRGTEDPALADLSDPLISYRTLPAEKPLYDIAKTVSGRTLAIAQYNSNSLDDIRCALALAKTVGDTSARFLSVRVHAPRCALMLKEEIRVSGPFSEIATGMITSEEVLGNFREGYASLNALMDESLETTPALAMTCVREIRGSYNNIERKNMTRQPATFIDSAATALTRLGGEQL
jgi:hypothetical protein